LFEPGRSWFYSNVGNLFVREMIEHRTGMDLGAALGRLVFEPRGIEAVSVARSAIDRDRTFWGNDRHYDKGWVYHGLIIGPPSAAAMLLHRLLYSSFLTSPLKAEILNAVAAGGPFPGRPVVASSYGLGLMIDPANRLGRMVGHPGQGPGSTAAVYSLSGRRESRTLAAFIADDSPSVQGTLEMHLQNLASDDGCPVNWMPMEIQL
jgi:D-alanyl-D-alanine carboxypeptidase